MNEKIRFLIENFTIKLNNKYSIEVILKKIKEYYFYFFYINTLEFDNYIIYIFNILGEERKSLDKYFCLILDKETKTYNTLILEESITNNLVSMYIINKAKNGFYKDKIEKLDKEEKEFIFNFEDNKLYLFYQKLKGKEIRDLLLEEAIKEIFK